MSGVRRGWPIGTVLIIGASILSSCRWPGGPRALGPDDYAVYTATLHEFFHHGDPARRFGQRIAVGSTTRDGAPLTEGEIRQWDSPPGSTVTLREANNDYRTRLGSHMPIQRFPGLPEDWLLIPWAEIDSALSAPYDSSRARAFRLRYPNVSPYYIGFSAVGFSKDRRHALLFLGGHSYLFFAKQDQEWKILGYPGFQIRD